MKSKYDLFWEDCERVASSHFLTERYPEDYNSWPVEDVAKYCEDNAWCAVKNMRGGDIYRLIYNLASDIYFMAVNKPSEDEL